MYDAVWAPGQPWLCGDTTVVLPENGWIVFSGEEGAQFHIYLSQPWSKRLAALSGVRSVLFLSAGPHRRP